MSARVLTVTICGARLQNGASAVFGDLLKFWGVHTTAPT